MKILLNCATPFSLAHGGAGIQIEQTRAALTALGLAVEPLRWWDPEQKGEIIHHFGRIPAGLIELAQQKGMKVVMAELLTATGSRSMTQLRTQKIISRFIKAFVPRGFSTAFNWRSYHIADACIALTPWEAHLMNYLFDAPKERIHVVPNGVEEVFLNSQKATRGQWLVCTATITERKRVLEVTQAAVQAQTPLWIIGKAYSEADVYAQRFFALAKQNSQFIRYEGAISDRAQLAQIYREARGFVLLSAMESLSLSALEAAACECPLLLSDLPWARSTFGNDANYCPITSTGQTSEILKKFYDAAPQLPPPPKPATWGDIARQLKKIYEQIMQGDNVRNL